MRESRQREEQWLRRCLGFVSWFCPPQLLEGIEGDLAEQYDRDIIAVGSIRARHKLIMGTLRFVTWTSGWRDFSSG